MPTLSTSALSALLTLLLLNTFPLARAASDRSICVRQNAPMFAEAAACGDRQSLQRCLLDAPSFVTLDDLQRCFIEADCTIAEAASEAIIILESCDASTSAPELRRRAEATPAATATPTPAPQTSNSPQSTSPATTAAALSKPTECSTARTIETTVCGVTSLGPDNFSRLPCTTTTLTTLECASTNHCFDDGGCMARDDSVPASGLVVTVVLALVVVGAAATLLYFYARERKARRVAREAAEAETRKLREEAVEAARKNRAKTEVESERLRRQQMAALDWARRRALDGQRSPDPFDDGAAVAVPPPAFMIERNVA